jgi:hypothetical protein
MGLAKQQLHLLFCLKCLIDNSEVPPSIIAEGSKNGEIKIHNNFIYKQIIKT